MSKVLDAVRSRTLPVRVAAPSVSDITDLLQFVAKKEGLALPPELAARIGAARRRAAAPDAKGRAWLCACGQQQTPRGGLGAPLLGAPVWAR